MARLAASAIATVAIDLLLAFAFTDWSVARRER